MHGLIRLDGQALEEVRQIRLGVDALPVAVADERVERGGAVSAGCIAHEQPVLLADAAGTDRVLHQVVVDLHTPLPQEHALLDPLVEGMAERLPGQVLRQTFATVVELFHARFEALHERGAMLLACAQDFLGTGACLTQSRFDLIQPLHLASAAVCRKVPPLRTQSPLVRTMRLIQQGR